MNSIEVCMLKETAQRREQNDAKMTLNRTLSNNETDVHNCNVSSIQIHLDSLALALLKPLSGNQSQ